jgi:hypothetical protein
VTPGTAAPTGAAGGAALGEAPDEPEIDSAEKLRLVKCLFEESQNGVNNTIDHKGERVGAIFAPAQSKIGGRGNQGAKKRFETMLGRMPTDTINKILDTDGRHMATAGIPTKSGEPAEFTVQHLDNLKWLAHPHVIANIMTTGTAIKDIRVDQTAVRDVLLPAARTKADEAIQKRAGISSSVKGKEKQRANRMKEATTAAVEMMEKQARALGIGNPHPGCFDGPFQVPHLAAAEPAEEPTAEPAAEGGPEVGQHLSAPIMAPVLYDLYACWCWRFA